MLCVFFSGGEILPVSRRAANEDVENVNFAPRRIQVRAAQTYTEYHLCIVLKLLK